MRTKFLLLFLALLQISCVTTSQTVKPEKTVYNGEWVKNYYKNDYANFSIIFPEFWQHSEDLLYLKKATIDRRYAPEVIVDGKSPPKTLPINATVRIFRNYTSFEALYKIEKRKWIEKLTNLTIKEPVRNDLSLKIDGAESKLSQILIGVSNAETLRIDKYFVYDEINKIGYTISLSVDSRYYPEILSDFEKVVNSFKILTKQRLITDYFEAGNQAFEEFKFALAVDYYKKSIERGIFSGELYQKLGYSLYSCEEKNSALKELQNALEKAKLSDFEKSKIHFALGDLHYNETRFLEAKNSYETAEKTGVPSYELYLRLAFTYTQLKNYDLAISSYEEAFAINPESLEVVESVAPLYERKFNYNASLEMWKKALKIRKASKNDEINSKETIDYINLQIKRLKELTK
ncbi:tetratricopeptide repeat protein [bacterium]|nr:tetratricopeptide repeat protein [bacterium]